MRTYSKGARTERELLALLQGHRYSVMRAAGSGVSSVAPDIIAIKEGDGLAFECKAWEKSNVAIEIEKIEMLMEWERNTHMHTFIAWRMNGEGWFFIKLNEMSKAEKNYVITRKNAVAIARRFENIILPD